MYSLGVLLYELLIGAVPFDKDTLRKAGLAEMLRIIREEEAPSLARKLTSMGAAASEIAARRQTDPISLRRLVDGDLNSIAMKALEKARERRYASVSDLAADLQRYLEHRPVLASPPSRIYRAPRFSAKTEPDRQAHNCFGRFCEWHRGPRLRRSAAPGPGCAICEFAPLDRAARRAREPDSRLDDATRGDQAHARSCG